MSLFRVKPDDPFSGPHQNQSVATAGVAVADAEGAMILIHGRGASARGMLQFADELDHDSIHYRGLQASNHTWYPKSFMAPKKLNEPGISSGLQAIYDQIKMLNENEIPTEKIALLGFSQGACLTTEYAARHPQKYGAIVGLSGGLIGEEVDPQNYSGSLEQTPLFLGCSDRDPHIPKERVDQTEQIFRQLEADVDKQIYKGLGHTVNQDEIDRVSRILDAVKKIEYNAFTG